MNEDTNFVLDGKVALPNKLLQSDGSITDITGKPVTASVESYDNKPALPNKFLNPDGTYSTLNEIIASMVDTSLFVIVDELPASGNEEKIYLVPDGKGGFTEYHWTGSKWDPIGEVEIDLSQYSTTEEMTAAIAVALNQAKSYTDTQIAGIKVTPQVYYWDGNVEQSGLDFWNNVYQIQKTTPCVVVHTESVFQASARYKTFVWHYYNNMPTGSGETINKNVASWDFNRYTTSTGYNTFTIVRAALYFTIQDDTITKIFYSTETQSINYLDTEKEISSNYTPRYNNSPATKKYVDDSIASSVTSALEESY